MTGKVVWKYILEPLDNELSVPPGTEFLYATGQQEAVVVYALVDKRVSSYRPEKRHLFVVGTGINALPAGIARPLGVASLRGGELMFHVFELP